MAMVSQMLQNSTTYYFHSTKIFIQLQPTIISFNNNICSTSTQTIFIQQKYLFTRTSVSHREGKRVEKKAKEGGMTKWGRRRDCRAHGSSHSLLG